jgi:hypothetical protein
VDDLRELDGAANLLRSRSVLDRADYVAVRWSFAELLAAQRLVVDEIAGLAGSGGATTAVDVKTNSIVVTHRSEMTADGRDRLRDARASTPVPVLEEVVDRDIAPRPASCSLPFCDRPLRGGVRMFSVGESCTAGFNATSRADGKRYVLTAGHCVTTPGYDWSTKAVPGGAGLAIGPAHNSSYYYGGDAGIVRDKVPSYWQQSPFPGATVVVDASGGTTYNPAYYIGGEADAVPGQILCATGVGWDGAHDVPLKFWDGTPYESFTWCGTVTANPVTVDYGGHSWERVYNLVRTNLCFHGGMSGGPVYKLNLAYGVISGDFCEAGHQEGYVYPAIRAENEMNVDIVH